VIQTDGQENDSREFDKARIAEMIKHQEDTYNWKFVFMSSDLRSAADAGSYGIHAGNTLRYAASSAGNDAMYSSLSNSVAKARSVDVDAFASMDTFDDADQQI